MTPSALQAYPIALPPVWRRKHLSPAEQRVVELVGGGLPTKAAAARLGKSTLTVRNQLNHAMRKLGVSSRYELIAMLRPAQLPADGALGATRPTIEAESFAYAI